MTPDNEQNPQQPGAQPAQQAPFAEQTQPTTPLPEAALPEAALPEAARADAPQPAASLSEVLPQPTQPTVPLPDTASQAAYSQTPPQPAPAYTAPPQHYAASVAPAAPATQFGQSFGPAQATLPAQHVQPAQTEKKSRAGVLFAGIAIGALVGGIVGGGASALVVANQQPTPIVQSQTNSGRVTLNNLDTATSVSGVAVAAIPSVVTLEISGLNAAGSGSGVIYSEDGYIVTNAHVVTLDGELIGTDPYADLAVVKIEADDLVPIELADSSELNVGDLAVAIGAPLNLSNTVTSGVVSALNRGISVGSPIIPDEQSSDEDVPDESSESPWFRFGDPNEGQSEQQQQQTQTTTTRVTLPVVQTDASINPGNSGGALLNANAELIGINVAIASNGSDSSTAGSDGLGFAIPVNLVKRVAESLIAGERPSHGLLGVSAADSTQDADADRNFAGGLIQEVVRGGAADQGGLQVGDVIMAVDGVPADSGTAVSALIRMHQGGDEVVISYTRGGVRGETTVTLGELQW